MGGPAIKAPLSDALIRRVAPALLVALLFAVTLLLFWSGIGPNDSDKYAGTALYWLNNGPTLGNNHWALRLPLVAPVAAGLALFGPGEFVSTLPNILYAAGLVATTFVFARKHLGDRAGLASAILVATSAFFVVVQSELSIAGAEAFFIALSCWLFVDALRSGADLKRYFAAGLCAGVAWLCREVAGFLPLTFALVLLARRPLRLDLAVAAGAGFAAVVLAELAAYWIVAGDPFYRLEIDFGHRGAGRFYAINPAQAGIFNRLWSPFEHMLTAPAFLPFVIAGALVWAAPGFRRAMARHSEVIVVFGVAAAASFIVSAYAANLKSPDYYPVVAYAALLSLGAFAAWLFDRGQKKWATALLASLIALNAATADFRGYDEYSEARYLAGFVRQSGESVTTDQKTAVRTRILLSLNGVNRAIARQLVLSSREREQALCGLVYSATPTGSARAIEPRPEWRELWSAEVRRKRWTHSILTAFGFTHSPSPRLDAILKGAGPVALYAAPPCP